MDDPLAGDSSFPWWFGRVWVDPSDAGDVWVAGLYLYRSIDGGDSWSAVGFDLHVDHHAMWIHPLDPDLLGRETTAGSTARTTAARRGRT